MVKEVTKNTISQLYHWLCVPPPDWVIYLANNGYICSCSFNELFHSLQFNIFPFIVCADGCHAWWSVSADCLKGRLPPHLEDPWPGGTNAGDGKTVGLYWGGPLYKGVSGGNGNYDHAIELYILWNWWDNVSLTVVLYFSHWCSGVHRNHTVLEQVH